MSETATQVSERSPADQRQIAPAKSKMPGAYSRDRLRRIDGRTLLGKHIRAFERGLVEHVGGRPSLPVRALIDQAVGLEVQIKLLEIAGITTDHDRRCYSAWLNAKRLTLRELGMKPAAERAPSLAEYLASKKAAAAAGPPPDEAA